MSSSHNIDSSSRLTAFVGRSFLDVDKGVWHELRDIFDSLTSLGFRYEDAKEAQLRPISEKVRSLIGRNEIYIGVLTKRYPICTESAGLKERLQYLFGIHTPTAWTTSEWVIEEIGYALGRDRRVLLLIEDGVSFPTTDLDGDTQWIKFRRSNIQASQSEISEMILGLIASRVVSVETSGPSAVAAAPDTSATAPEQPSRSDRFATFREHVDAGRFREAETLQRELVEEEGQDEDDRKWIDSFLLSDRARHGDTDALNKLKDRVRSEPGNAYAVQSLASVHLSFEQYRMAADLLLQHLEDIPAEHRAEVVMKASQALRRNKDVVEAIQVLLGALRNENDESIRLKLIRELARAAADKEDMDLEAALLEKYLAINPADSEERFRLGHVYGDADRDKLSAHHYGLVTQHGDSPGGHNNLALAYSALGLKSKRVDELQKAADRYPLAKANLASQYVDAGFLSNAREIATAVLSVEPDGDDAKKAMDRARYVLDEARKMEQEDTDAINKLFDETKAERDFMIAYADAYCAPRIAPFSGSYNTPHGDLVLTCTGTELKGTGSFQKTEPVGALSALLYSQPPPKPRTVTVTLTFAGKMEGHAGTFELSISSTAHSIPTLLGDGSRTITGLFCVQDEGAKILFLEREGSRCELKTARRKT